MTSFIPSPFLIYISHKFDRPITEALEKFIIDNKEQLEEKTKYVNRITDANVEEVDYKQVWINDTPGMKLEFNVAVQVTVAIKGPGNRDILNEYIYKWYLVSCEGDVSSNLNDFKIVDIDEYTQKNKPKNPMSGDLVPIISRKEYDKYANEILEKYYPEAINEPIKIRPKLLAKRMGLTVVNHRITEDHSIFGQIYFKDCTQELYDPETQNQKKYKIKANTLIYDRDAVFLQSYGSKNMTIAHECVHYELHKKAFLFAQLFDKSLKLIECEVKGGIKGTIGNKSTMWMENQANAIAPHILMPTKSFIKKIKELTYKYECFSDDDLLNKIEIIIQELASFYEISIYAAKKRMVEVGYHIASGAFNWIDGRYVRPYAYEKGSLELNETYTISYKDIVDKISYNSKIAEALFSGKLVYIENHVCINHPKFISKDLEGNLILTTYARMHLNECCLKFTYTSQDRSYGQQYVAFCYLCKGEYGLSFDINIDYDRNDKVLDVDLLKKDHDQYMEDIKEMRKIQLMSVAEALTFLMDYQKLGVKDLATESGLSTKTVSRYKNGLNTDNEKKTMVALARGLRLPVPISSIFLGIGNITLSINMPEDNEYLVILQGMLEYSPAQVNNYLTSLGFEPLTDEKE